MFVGYLVIAGDKESCAAYDVETTLYPTFDKAKAAIIKDVNDFCDDLSEDDGDDGDDGDEAEEHRSEINKFAADLNAETFNLGLTSYEIRKLTMKEE